MAIEVVSAISGINERQTITLANATGGTYTLSYGGSTTAAIAHNATAATIQEQLRGLSSINGPHVNVTGNAGGPYTVEFVNWLAAKNVAQMTRTSSLTGSSPTVTIATSVPGSQLNGFTKTTANPTKNYAGDYPAGTIIVIGYQNSTASSSAGLNSTPATDDAGNTYTRLRSAGSASKGETCLIYCRLQTAVTSSNIITFSTLSTQSAAYIASGFIERNLTFQASAIAGTESTNATTWSTPSVTVPTKLDYGLLVGVFGFEDDAGFATKPSASPSGHTFLGFNDVSVTIFQGSYTTVSTTTITVSSPTLRSGEWVGCRLAIGSATAPTTYGTISANTSSSITVSSWVSGTPSANGTFFVVPNNVSCSIGLAAKVLTASGSQNVQMTSTSSLANFWGITAHFYNPARSDAVVVIT